MVAHISRGVKWLRHNLASRSHDGVTLRHTRVTPRFLCAVRASTPRVDYFVASPLNLCSYRSCATQ
jgi:hypothetical protein